MGSKSPILPVECSLRAGNPSPMPLLMLPIPIPSSRYSLVSLFMVNERPCTLCFRRIDYNVLDLVCECELVFGGLPLIDLEVEDSRYDM